jgi:hypothetical protein
LHFDTGFTDYLPWQPVSEASRTHCRAGTLAAALDIPAPPRGGSQMGFDSKEICRFVANPAAITNCGYGDPIPLR